MSLLYLSSAIAVVLWLLATLLQGGLCPDLPVPAPQAEPAQESLRQANPPAEERLSLQEACTRAESEIRSIVGNARQCATDDDCTLFDYGYPIDCMTSVAKSEIVTLREGFRKYGERCEHRVFYDCPTEPFVRLPVCQSGRCEVELVDPRDLQDETLEQLERGQLERGQ